MDVVRNDPVYINRTPFNYIIRTNKGEAMQARGTLRLCGDFVIIGDNVYHRPDSVEEQ